MPKDGHLRPLYMPLEASARSLEAIGSPLVAFGQPLGASK